jgi:hypothetical protein
LSVEVELLFLFFAKSGISTTPNYWDGVSNQFYLWKNFPDDTIDAPQVGLMSQLFARDAALKQSLNSGEIARI